MRKTVIISSNDYKDIDMDVFDLHAYIFFKTAEELNLNPEVKEQIYLGELFLKNGYVAMQITDYYTIVYLPDNINYYQIDTMFDYLDKYTQYNIVDSTFDGVYYPTMNYFEFLTYLNGIKSKILKKCM